MSFSPGDVIDNKYRVVRLIGEGGMGAVYEGENTRISRRVAIKVLRTEAASRPELAARFEREARAAAKIGSKHVCDVLDLGDLPNGDSYLVMEFLDGEDLASRMKRLGRMGDAEVLAIAYQLTDGLATMHEAGIIHRDLKPANVFLARGSHGRDTVKILDFGVSKFASQQNESLHMTATGAVMGTPLYMSPEQARGAKDIDARSDLYAVGVVLYKAVTGKLPFKGDNFNEILFKIALETPPSVLELAPDVDPDLAAIIERAMAKDPADRYQTARELNEALFALGTARGVALETSVSIPPPGSLTPGKGVTPLPSLRLPPPSRVPGFTTDRTMNLPGGNTGNVAVQQAAQLPQAENESAAVPLTAVPVGGQVGGQVAGQVGGQVLSPLARARRSSAPPPHAQDIAIQRGMQAGAQQIADGFTSTAWAGHERASSPTTPHSTHPSLSGESIVSGTANTEAATPSPGVAKARAKLAARLEEDNRRAAARTRNIVFAIVGLLGVSVAGFVAASRMSASGVDPAAVAQEPASAGIPAAAPPPPPASAAPPAAVAAPASAGVDVGALPLLNGTNPVPTVQPNALPVVQRGATTASAAANGAVSAAPSAAAVAKPAPSASAEAPKKEWGVIAPTVPTIERPAEAPAPAPASTPSP